MHFHLHGKFQILDLEEFYEKFQTKKINVHTVFEGISSGRWNFDWKSGDCLIERLKLLGSPFSSGKVKRLDHSGTIKNMDSSRSRDLPTEHLVPELKKDDNQVKVISQQDNACIHTSWWKHSSSRRNHFCAVTSQVTRSYPHRKLLTNHRVSSEKTETAKCRRYCAGTGKIVVHS